MKISRTDKKNSDETQSLLEKLTCKINVCNLHNFFSFRLPLQLEFMLFHPRQKLNAIVFISFV